MINIHQPTHPPTHPPTRTIKVFEIFKKADFSRKIEIVDFCSPITYKMERLSSGPHRAQFSQFPSGDKNFILCGLLNKFDLILFSTCQVGDRFFEKISLFFRFFWFGIFHAKLGNFALRLYTENTVRKKKVG